MATNFDKKEFFPPPIRKLAESIKGMHNSFRRIGTWMTFGVGVINVTPSNRSLTLFFFPARRNQCTASVCSSFNGEKRVAAPRSCLT